MKPNAQKTYGATTAADRAAAAAWIARLHGEDRTSQLEAGLRRWLASSPAHRRAFELASDLWIEVERWPKRQAPEFVGWRRTGFAFSMSGVLAAAGLVGLLVAGAIIYGRDPGIATGLGEQRNLTLEDGSRVALNTLTRIRILYDRTTRLVELERGEALFEVAKSPDRPFVVIAAGKQVTALGTSFLVRRDDERVAVTLLEGKVAVSPQRDASRPATRSSASNQSQRQRSGTASTKNDSRFTLAPGQRLSFINSRPPEMDQPLLDKVLAWRRGEVILDHTPLEEAVAEMNRYSAIQLSIEDLQARQVRITGIFQAGDSENFALAVADTYRLTVRRDEGRIFLTGVPNKR